MTGEVVSTITVNGVQVFAFQTTTFQYDGRVRREFWVFMRGASSTRSCLLLALFECEEVWRIRKGANASTPWTGKEPIRQVSHEEFAKFDETTSEAERLKIIEILNLKYGV